MSADNTAHKRPEPAFVPFPLQVLPTAVRRYIEDGSAAIGCDPSFLALPLLAGLAACIGTSRQLILKPGTWPEPAILWTAISGRSGTKKSPALRIATEPLSQHDALVEKLNAKRMSAFRAERATFASRMKTWEREVRKNPTLDRPREPIPPPHRQFIIIDTTIEATLDAHYANPRGLFACYDELAVWLDFDRYKSSADADRALWLSLHNGGAVKLNRKTGLVKRISLPMSAVSLTGGIQPAVLRAVLTREFRVNGLAARFLMAMPPERSSPWSEAQLSQEVRSAMKHLVKRLHSLRRQEGPDGLLVPVPLRLGPEAKQLWIAFHNQFELERQAMDNDDLEAVWAKLQGQSARLALVLELAAWAAKGGGGAPPTVLSARSMRAGIELASWFANEARRVYAVLDESRHEEQLRLRIDSIRRNGGAVSVRDWQRTHRSMTAQRARTELLELVRAGYGAMRRTGAGPKGGRSSERFVAHP